MKGTTGGGTPGRYLVEKIRCTKCGTVQPVGIQCAGCSQTFADYVCRRCCLWGSMEAYHCTKCGICRVGKKEDYWHCDTCEACYSVSSAGEHKCVERALDSDCPVCMEHLFTSAVPLCVGPNCGHAMHPDCLKSYLSSGKYSCPVCFKSLVDLSTIDHAQGFVAWVTMAVRGAPVVLPPACRTSAAVRPMRGVAAAVASLAHVAWLCNGVTGGARRARQARTPRGALVAVAVLAGVGSLVNASRMLAARFEASPSPLSASACIAALLVVSWLWHRARPLRE